MSRFPDVLPPPDGLASAFRDATRRRTRTAAATGGAGLLACCLMLAAVTAGGTQTLSQEPVPPAEQVQPPALTEQLPQAEPSTAQDEAEQAPLVPSGAAPRSVATASSSPPASEPKLPHPATRSEPRRGTAGHASNDSGARRPVTRSTAVASLNTPDCAARSGPLCSRAYAGVQGDDSYLDLSLCNGTTEDVTLRLPHKDEVDFEVREGNRRHWRWSHGHPRKASAHRVVVGVGTCLVWRTMWPLVDQGGAPLPAGAYTLLGTIDSADAGEAASAEFEFTIR